MSDSLLATIYRNDDKLLSDVEALLDCGADPSAITKHGESPLRVASNNGRFDVVKLLLSRGGDAAQLQWNNLFHAVAYGSLNNLEECVTGQFDLEERDFWQRTPFLFAILVGDIQKVEMLLAAGADASAVGWRSKTPLAYAIQNDNAKMLRWLLEHGFDAEQTDEFGDTPLLQAAEHGAHKCVQVLIDFGVDLFRENSSHQQAIGVTENLNIVNDLVKAGADLNDMDKDARAAMLGYRTNEEPNVTQQEYLEGKGRIFGVDNPKLCNRPFWQAMVHCGGSAYSAISKFESKRDIRNTEPVWSYDRFGKSMTSLGDGRFIEIAGEHEDHYDPDFCIYNDVFVHDGKGDCQIYIYPREAFPPTDFHSATFVDGKIIVIGNLGYLEDRQPGFTPVYCLDVQTLVMENVPTTGDMPGWISNHKARLNNRKIVVRGGKVIVLNNSKQDYIDNCQTYELCLQSKRWRTVE